MSDIDAIKKDIENIVHTRYQKEIKNYEKNLENILGDNKLIVLGVTIFGDQDKFTGWLLTDNIFFGGKPIIECVEKIKYELKNVDYSIFG